MKLFLPLSVIAAVLSGTVEALDQAGVPHFLRHLQQVNPSVEEVECCPAAAPIALELDKDCATSCDLEGCPLGYKFKKCGSFQIQQSVFEGTSTIPVDLSCDATSVTVTDPYGPSITCPADETWKCGAPPQNVAEQATATDNCAATVSVSGDNDPTCATKEVSVPWTATDTCGQTATCTQKKTYVDNAPEFIAPACDPVGWTCGQGTLAPPTVTDDCTKDITATTQSATPTLTCKSPTATVDWTATDSCGQTTTCTQTINYVDNANPTCTFGAATPPIPDGKTKYECGTSITGSITANDDCGSATVTPTSFSATLTPSSGAVDPCKGSVTLSATATDDCDKTGTCSKTFEWEDKASPKFKCKTDNSCPANANVCSITPAGQLCASDCQYTNLPTGQKCFNAADNPSTAINICAGGTVTRTWSTGLDDCGNAGDTVTQTLIVPAQGPGAPTKKSDPTTCGNLPEVCVDVPVCTPATGTTGTPEKRCATANGNGFVFGTPSTPTGCSGTSASRTVDVTYTDPVTGCTASATGTNSISYWDKCCCKSDTAYVQYSDTNGDDHCTDKPPINAGNWGWYFGPQAWNTDFNLVRNIGAGRAQCDLTKGYKAGTANIKYVAATKMLTVTVAPEAGVTFASGLLWVGKTPLPKKTNGDYFSPPAQFGNPLASPYTNWAITVTNAMLDTSNQFYFAIHLQSQRTTTCS